MTAYRQRHPPPQYQLTSTVIPAGDRARGYNARNGIAAKLLRYLQRLQAELDSGSGSGSDSDSGSPGNPRSDRAVSVPVPATTTPEAFRAYICNYMRGHGVSIATRMRQPKQELIVWLRRDWAPLADRKAADAARPVDRMGLAPLWPIAEDTGNDIGNDNDNGNVSAAAADIALDADGTPIIYI